MIVRMSQQSSGKLPLIQHCDSKHRRPYTNLFRVTYEVPTVLQSTQRE